MVKCSRQAKNDEIAILKGLQFYKCTVHEVRYILRNKKKNHMRHIWLKTESILHKSLKKLKIQAEIAYRCQ
jgi:hypothetical protein